MTYVLQLEGNTVLKHYFRSPRGVYEFLYEHYDHDTSASAEGWCELASIGEEYEGSGLFNGALERCFTICVQ